MLTSSSLWVFFVVFYVQNLMIQETSPGMDGQQYNLRFTAEIPDTDIASFDLPFLFYNGLFVLVFLRWYVCMFHCGHGSICLLAQAVWMAA